MGNGRLMCRKRADLKRTIFNSSDACSDGHQRAHGLPLVDRSKVRRAGTHCIVDGIKEKKNACSRTLAACGARELHSP